MRDQRYTVVMTAGSPSGGRQEDTARTWTHIKVLYILCILLSAVVMALFIVCFMMIMEVQSGLNDEIKLRKVSLIIEIGVILKLFRFSRL